MMCVDSSIWISYFAHHEDKGAQLLDRALAADEEIFVLPLIRTEVLMGFRHDRDFQEAMAILSAVPSLSLPDETYTRAAQMFRSLKKKGVTVRGAIDCIIAQACMDHSAELLTVDKDFSHIAKHTKLKLAYP
jgi:predicted nucleic acid-binding protein